VSNRGKVHFQFADAESSGFGDITRGWRGVRCVFNYYAGCLPLAQRSGLAGWWRRWETRGAFGESQAFDLLE